MDVPIFLSYARPHLQRQEAFVASVEHYLRERGIHPRTLGVRDYDTQAPLTAIRRILLESNGLLTIAFRRMHIDTGTFKKDADVSRVRSVPVSDIWLTSPWCHIEAAMAFQLGLPILVFREKGVYDDGILEKGVTGTYLPEFDLEDTDLDYFQTPEWRQLMADWEGYVRTVVRAKGNPPKLY